MSRLPWEKDFKLTLFIYPENNGELSSEPLKVEIEGESVELLKEQIDELILKTVPESGKCFGEMLIEADSEYYDSDEQWFNVLLEEKRVVYDY